MTTATDGCVRCHGLVVREIVMVVDRMTAMPKEELRRWWRRADTKVVLKPGAIVQTRCLNCGGVVYA